MAPDISLCMIARDETGRIGHALESVFLLMAVREPDKTALSMDGARYQVELGFNVQLQGNDAEITPVPPTPSL